MLQLDVESVIQSVTNTFHLHTIYNSPAHPTLWQEMPAKVLTCEMINVIVKRSSSWLSKCKQIIPNETLPHSHMSTWYISNPTTIRNHGHHSLVLSLPSATRVTDCQYCNAHFWKVQDEVEPWKEILVIHKRTTTKREDQKILWRTKTMSHCDHMWSHAHAHDLVTVWQCDRTARLFIKERTPTSVLLYSTYPLSATGYFHQDQRRPFRAACSLPKLTKNQIQIQLN